LLTQLRSTPSPSIELLRKESYRAIAFIAFLLKENSPYSIIQGIALDEKSLAEVQMLQTGAAMSASCSRLIASLASLVIPNFFPF